MNKELLQAIISDPSFAKHIVYEKIIPASSGTYSKFPDTLPVQLATALRTRGIEQLYTHQADVWEASQQGNNVIVVTPTASGKTLSYNLPVLSALLKDDNARALYLFPTKALSQDQQSELNELILASHGLLPIKICTYDGDTPESLRIAARDTGRIIISNPDMLHTGILPNHPKWIKFFSRLTYIVIDEAHAYRGVFGSHVANVLRRLKRITAFYGAKPQFILCSATIGNPQELAESLIGEPVLQVSNNGAPQSEKRIILYNPPIVDSIQGIRKSSINESRRWAVALLKAGIKTILFAHSRIKTEVAASYIREDLANFYTDNSRIRIEPYRGGLLPNERREIERGLREGTIHGVVSTNALELGIDIGGLDAAVVAGYPGSFNSFWQQIGRAGRRGGVSVAIFVASSAPLDQFIMNDPDWFFSKNHENARLDPDNPYIYLDHIKCAAFELPFNSDTLTTDPFGVNAHDALEFLEEDGIVRLSGNRWHWSDRSYPAENISLRSAASNNVVIIDTTQGRNAVIAEMDRPSAKELLFDNAVYIHRGNQFIVTKLDLENHKCFVEESETNYYTDALVKTDIKTLSEDESYEYAVHEPNTMQSNQHEPQRSILVRAIVGDVLVRSQVAKYKKIRFHTHENIGYGDIAVPEEEVQTRAIALLFGDDTIAGNSLTTLSEEALGDLLAGLGNLVKHIAPMFLLCDSRDIGIAARVRDPHFEVPALYLYDHYPGGTGLAEGIAEKVPDLLRSTAKALLSCPCKKGCPSCVGPEHDKTLVVNFFNVLTEPSGLSSLLTQ